MTYATYVATKIILSYICSIFYAHMKLILAICSINVHMAHFQRLLGIPLNSMLTRRCRESKNNTGSADQPAVHKVRRSEIYLSVGPQSDLDTLTFAFKKVY